MESTSGRPWQKTLAMARKGEVVQVEAILLFPTIKPLPIR